jgi:hypothetical protein
VTDTEDREAQRRAATTRVVDIMHALLRKRTRESVEELLDDIDFDFELRPGVDELREIAEQGDEVAQLLLDQVLAKKEALKAMIVERVDEIEKDIDFLRKTFKTPRSPG